MPFWPCFRLYCGKSQLLLSAVLLPASCRLRRTVSTVADSTLSITCFVHHRCAWRTIMPGSIIVPYGDLPTPKSCCPSLNCLPAGKNSRYTHPRLYGTSYSVQVRVCVHCSTRVYRPLAADAQPNAWQVRLLPQICRLRGAHWHTRRPLAQETASPASRRREGLIKNLDLR